MNDYTKKIIDRNTLRDVVARLRQQGAKLVFTNGVFDLLHIGHVRYLYEASKRGDVLIVGVNSDASTRRLKGPSRPIINEDERAEMLAALAFVDYVVIFEEDTPDELIKIVRPDVHIKGGDYRPEDLPEGELVRSLGGEVVVAPLVDGRSTSITIARILQRHAPWLKQEAEEEQE